MDALFQAVVDLLNGLLPDGESLTLDFTTMNEFLAYVITIGVIWVFLLKPLLKLLRLSK
jgi:hypothetical protein